VGPASATEIDLAGGIAALVVPWLVTLATAAIAGDRYRSAAVGSDLGAPVPGTGTVARTRVLRGSLAAGATLGLVLFLLSLAPVAASPSTAAAYVAAWRPLLALGLLSCFGGGVAIVAAARGAFAVPRAQDSSYEAVSAYVHARQDARDRAAARRRRAATARREANRHRNLTYRLDAMDDMTGEEFEQLCGDYFAALGYTVDFTPQSGDGGIDLILTRDRTLGVAQCKRTRKPVGEPVVRDLFGALHHTGADEAFLCASAGFTPAAEHWAEGKPITLVGGDEIVSTLRRRR
jgi:hypothetical protein